MVVFDCKLPEVKGDMRAVPLHSTTLCNSLQNNGYIPTAVISAHRVTDDHCLSFQNSLEISFHPNICKTYGHLAKYLNTKLIIYTFLGKGLFSSIGWLFEILTNWTKSNSIYADFHIIKLIIEEDSGPGIHFTEFKVNQGRVLWGPESLSLYVVQT